MRESFPSHGSGLSKAGLVRADPLLDGIPCIVTTHRNPLAPLGNTGLWPFGLRSIGRQLRDAPSDGRRSSFAFPSLRRFHIRSCPARPGRRGHIRRVTAGLGFFGHLHAVPCTLPCGWGGHDRRGPERQRFHVLHSLPDGFRSALLHRQFCECAPGHVRRPGLDCLPFWLQP